MTHLGYPIEILLVEDNPADVRLMKEALRESRVRNDLHVVEDGVEAMDFLRREGKYCNAVRPDIVLLDLNLPKKSGLEVLKEVKGDEEFKNIPVVVLTTSRSDEDIVSSYNLHANCYISKPVDLEEFLKVIRTTEDFWLTIVKLPKC